MRRGILRRLLPAVTVLCLVPVSQAGAFERLEQYGVGYPTPSNGGLLAPYSTSVSPGGTVVVSDISTMRASIFSQAGQFLLATGKNVATGGGNGAEICVTDCRTGESGPGAGELGTPWGIFAGADEFYVAEVGNSRVSVFNYQGQFLRAFGASVGGAGVNLCTTSCVAGTAGALSGQMASPVGLALDAAGNLYVSEVGTDRVDVFNPQTGAFIRAFGKNVGGAGVNTCTNPCAAGVADGTPGSVNDPFGLSASPAGEIFIAEVGASRVSVFSQEGQFLRVLGAPGTGAGQLATPYGVAAAGDGNVYVADTANNRLSVFGAGGEFRRAMGLDVVPGAPAAAETCTSLCQAGTAGFGIGEFAEPHGVAVDCRGAVYVASLGRIEKFGEPGNRLPPCPSNAMSIGAQKKNKKKGTVTVEVTVAGPGTLTGSAGAKLSAAIPQPVAAGTLTVTIKAAGKGVKTLKKKGKLKGTLSLTFTPPNGDPNTQTAKVVLKKKLKKHKKGKKRSGKGGSR